MPQCITRDSVKSVIIKGFCDFTHARYPEASLQPLEHAFWDTILITFFFCHNAYHSTWILFTGKLQSHSNPNLASRVGIKQQLFWSS